MRIRTAVALLALCFFTASSWASLCDLSCAFAQFHPTRHSMNHSRSTESFDANRNMPAHADHGCCRNGDRESAIRLRTSPCRRTAPSIRVFAYSFRHLPTRGRFLRLRKQSRLSSPLLLRPPPRKRLRLAPNPGSTLTWPGLLCFQSCESSSVYSALFPFRSRN